MNKEKYTNELMDMSFQVFSSSFITHDPMRVVLMSHLKPGARSKPGVFRRGVAHFRRNPAGAMLE